MAFYAILFMVSIWFFCCLPSSPTPHHPHPLCSPQLSPCPSQPVSSLPPPPCWLPGWPHLASALSLCPHASTLCPWSEPDVRQGLAGVHGRTLQGRRRSSVSQSPSSGRLLILHLSSCQPWMGQCLQLPCLEVELQATGCWLSFLFREPAAPAAARPGPPSRLHSV